MKVVATLNQISRESWRDPTSKLSWLAAGAAKMKSATLLLLGLYSIIITLV
jgi:hypothetical protein